MSTISFDLTLKLDNQELTYRISRNNKRRRRISLQLDLDGCLEVRAPVSLSNNYIHKWLLADCQPWIEKQLNNLKANKLHMPIFTNGAKHYYLGKLFILNVNLCSSNIIKVELAQDKIIMQLPCDSVIKDSLWQWYKHQAKKLFSQRLTDLLKLTPWVKSEPNLKIRSMKTRWGSCSSLGNINLNMHLIKAPAECIDYVILHELCHIAEFNHSVRFYKLMTQVCPLWKQHEKLLKEVGFVILSRK